MDAQKKRTWFWVVAGLVIVVGFLWSRYWATQKLMRDLDSKNPRVAREAAATLVARNILEDSLPAQPVPRRVNAARALGLVGNQGAFTQLAAVLKDPEDKPQEAATRAFGRAGAPGIPYLLPVLKDGDDRAKKAAVAAFSLIGEPAISPLTKALQNKDQRDQAVKALAQIAIDRFLWAEQASPPAARAMLAVAEQAIQPLLQASQDRDLDLRIKAIEALGSCHERRGVPQGVAALQNPDQRLTAIRALGLMRDPRATMSLVLFLKDQSLRIDTVTALGQIADLRAVPYLLAELTDPETQFHTRAVIALQRIGAPASPQLAQALKHPNVYVRRAAAQALCTCRLPAVNGPVTAALQGDRDPQVRQAAAAALGWQGNAAAVPALIAALGDPQWQVADAAVAALGHVGPQAVPALVGLFAQSTDRAYQASRALASMGEGVSDTLIAQLASANPQVRRWSALTLGTLRAKKAEPALQRMAKSSDPGDRWVAAEALRKLTVKVSASES